jgi:hypothetical protein
MKRTIIVTDTYNGDLYLLIINNIIYCQKTQLDEKNEATKILLQDGTSLIVKETIDNIRTCIDH